MLKPKKKFTKKELKEDKFVLYTFKARDWLQDHGRLVMNIGIGVLVVIILVTFYVRSKHNANVEANALLGEAQIALNQNDNNRAETLLKQLVQDYDGVNAAGQGTFILGRTYWQLNDYTNAKIYFKKYFDNYADDDLLTSGAYAGYADCLMNENNIKEAAVYYERAGQVNRNLPQTPSYLYSAASAYMQLQDFTKAKELAQDIIDNYGKSEFKVQAEVLLNMADFEA